MVKNRHYRGFTLIEMLVVIAIIGLLASTILASMVSSKIQARDSQRLQEARQLMLALEIFRNQHSQYPCSGMVSGNVVLLCSPASFGGTEPVVLKGNDDSYSEMALELRHELHFKPGLDFVGAGIIYRLRSHNIPDVHPDPLSYTILVYLEKLNQWCEINSGPGHVSYSYPNCPMSAI